MISARLKLRCAICKVESHISDRCSHKIIKPDSFSYRLENLSGVERFHMKSQRPYWSVQNNETAAMLVFQSVLWEFTSLLMQTLSFVPLNLHRCWPRECETLMGRGGGDLLLDKRRNYR